MAGVNWHLEMSVILTLNGLFLQMLRLSVVEITLCVCTKTMYYFHSWSMVAEYFQRNNNNNNLLLIIDHIPQ